MKPIRLLFLLIALSLILPIHADTITEITSISNPQQIFDYDTYNGYVLNYENRLIVQNHYKVEDYTIESNGQLERIGLFEKKEPFSAPPQIDGDKYYVLDKRPHEPFIDGIYVFDLSQTPMVLQTYIELEYLEIDSHIDSTNVGCFFFSQSHIFIPDPDRSRAWKVSKETFEVDGFIDGFFGGIILKENDLMVHIFRTGYDYQLILSSFGDDHQIQPISSLVINTNAEGVNDMYLFGDKVVLTLSSSLIIVDISDAETPSIFCTIAYYGGFTGALYDDNILYGYSRPGDILVYQIGDTGEYSLITTLPLEYRGQTNSNICKVGSYLYINGYIALYVVDISINAIETIGSYGVFGRYPSYSVSQDDIYYLKQHPYVDYQEIYSVLDNRLICTLAYPFMIIPDREFFRIIGDRLYVSVTTDDEHFFDIYQLAGENATLLNRVFIGNVTGRPFHIIGDKVFFTYVNPEVVEVYRLANDNLEYLSSFNGRMQHFLTVEPTEYFYHMQGNTLYLKDINDISNILYQRQVNNLSHYLVPLDDHHFVNSVYDGGHTADSYIYRFDIEQNTLQQIGHFADYGMTAHNGVIVANSFIFDDNTYYSIQDDNLSVIGDLTTSRKVWHTYFFPERHKMVQVAYSGIWTYDIEYTSDGSADTDVVVALPSAVLHGNYPNPFNPTTTISFSLSCSERVVIDVYNVRGQLVRGLVSGVYGAGSHTVVWNGCGDDGRSVGSGVYFYRMVSGGGVSMKKMVMVK